MNDQETKIAEKIFLILKKKKNKQLTNINSKHYKRHLKNRKLVLNHLELYRSQGQLSELQKFFRVFDFVIPSEIKSCHAENRIASEAFCNIMYLSTLIR